MITTRWLRPLAMLALCAGAGVSHAAIAVYTDQTSFLAAVTGSAVDSFDDLPQGVGLGLGVALNRSAGSYGYTASATARGAADQFYNSGAGADTWLSTNEPDATIMLSGFGPTTNAVGGFWFGSGADGGFVADAPLTLIVSDADGASRTRNFAAPTESFFLGFVSNVALSMITLNSSNPLIAWASINNLVLAHASAVPETGGSISIVAGLLALALALRVRRRAATR